MMKVAKAKAQTANNKMKKKQKREIRRRVHEYEQTYHTDFGGLVMQADLMKACRAQKDVHKVVLVVYAMAKISLHPSHHNCSGSAHFPAFDKDASLAARFGRILWSPRAYSQDDDKNETPLCWALEGAARDVVRFIVAWYILFADHNNPSFWTAVRHHKHSMLDWLHLVGDTELLGGDNDNDQELRVALYQYKSLENKFSLESMVSCLIAPYITAYPFLEKAVNTVLWPAAANDNKSHDTLVAGCDDNINNNDTKESSSCCALGDGYSLCNDESENDDGAFSLVDDGDFECHNGDDDANKKNNRDDNITHDKEDSESRDWEVLVLEDDDNFR